MALPALGSWSRRIEFSHHLPSSKQLKTAKEGTWGRPDILHCSHCCRNQSLVSIFLQSLLFLLAVCTVTVTPQCLLIFVIHAVLYIQSCFYCLRSLLEIQGDSIHKEKNV